MADGGDGGGVPLQHHGGLFVQYAGDVSGGVDYRIWKKADRKMNALLQKKKREHERPGIKKSAPYSNKNENTAV